MDARSSTWGCGGQAEGPEPWSHLSGLVAVVRLRPVSCASDTHLLGVRLGSH